MKLERFIFFKDNPSYMDAVKRWPMYLRRDLWENTFAMFYQGQPVSAICRLTRDMVFAGHVLRIGFVGGVCTHPDHRGKGLAGTVLDATLQRFMDTDVDFVYISGARPLYYRTGANHIGGFSRFFLNSEALRTVDTEVRIRKAGPADVEILYALNKKELLRLAHDRRDYELVIENGHCSGGPCTFSIVEQGSTPVAYIALRGVDYKEGRWSQRIIEFAGDREAILSALVIMANELGPDGQFVMELWPEEKLATRFHSMGIKCVAGRMGGTVKALDFTRTMEKLRSCFAPRIGSDFTESLEFAAGKERYVISGKGDVLEIDGEANMLWTLLGAPPEKQIENARATGFMKKAFESCLPIPLPALHLNII